MAHIHELIDFTVCIFVVHAHRVLMIKHKQLGIWLPLGGHIELNEHPETAARREAKEESGLDVELIGNKPNFSCPGTEFLIPPAFLDIHWINKEHRHIGMIYFAASKTADVTLAVNEHDDIRWFTPADLVDPTYALSAAITFYAKQALSVVTTS